MQLGGDGATASRSARAACCKRLHHAGWSGVFVTVQLAHNIVLVQNLLTTLLCCGFWYYLSRILVLLVCGDTDLIIAPGPACSWVGMGPLLVGLLQQLAARGCFPQAGGVDGFAAIVWFCGIVMKPHLVVNRNGAAACRAVRAAGC
jgi:hypothetical protein